MSAVMNGPLQRSGAGNRALNCAILASVVLHGALLFLLSLERQERGEAAVPKPIVARLVSPPAAAPAPPAPTPPKPEPRKAAPQKPPVEPPKPVPRVVKPAPVPRPAPVPEPARKESSVQPAPAAPPQPATPAPSVEPAPRPPGPAAPSPSARVDPQPGAAPSADAESLQRYQEELVEMMRRYKRYPRVALDNNWEGTVVLKMVIGANGMIASLSVVSSTGHEVLDKQALDMIQKAKGRVPIPSALRGRAYPVEVPVIFSTKDQGSG